MSGTVICLLALSLGAEAESMEVVAKRLHEKGLQRLEWERNQISKRPADTRKSGFVRNAKLLRSVKAGKFYTPEFSLIEPKENDFGRMSRDEKLEVVEVVNETTMVMVAKARQYSYLGGRSVPVDAGERIGNPVLIKNVPTDKIVEGQELKFDATGILEVQGVEMWAGRKVRVVGWYKLSELEKVLKQENK